MMAEFWRTRHFKALSKQWAEKLRDAEFEDAEIELSNDRSLKQRASNAYRQASQVERESRLDYYLLVGQLANRTNFPNEMEKIVMLLHADGASINEITEEIYSQGLAIKKRDYFEAGRKRIRHIIRRWHMKWGIKTWTPKQMNLKKVTS